MGLRDRRQNAVSQPTSHPPPQHSFLITPVHVRLAGLTPASPPPTRTPTCRLTGSRRPAASVSSSTTPAAPAPSARRLAQALDQLRPGDTLVVWKLDRLARSLRHLIDLVTTLQDRGVGFRSLREDVDTTSPGGPTRVPSVGHYPGTGVSQPCERLSHPRVSPLRSPPRINLRPWKGGASRPEAVFSSNGCSDDVIGFEEHRTPLLTAGYFGLPRF